MILARYGPFFLYAYTVIMGLGVVLALGLSAELARRASPVARLDGWLDGALAAAAGALLAGRIVFVWLNQPYFTENPAEAWQLWRGGLAYHGALLGGIAALALWARLTRRPLGPYLGLFAPGLALLAIAGWTACRFGGCAYGQPAAPGLLAAQLPDNLGVLAVRYRTQLFGALGSAAVFGLSLWAAWRSARPAPLLFWATLGGLSLVRVAVALGRGDTAPMVAGWRVDLVVDLGVAVAAAGVVAVLLMAGRRFRAARPGA